MQVERNKIITRKKRIIKWMKEDICKCNYNFYPKTERERQYLTKRIRIRISKSVDTLTFIE